MYLSVPDNKGTYLPAPPPALFGYTVPPPTLCHLLCFQHLEVSLRVKPFRPKTSGEARDWILEQVALGDVDVWRSIVTCTID